MGDKTGIEWTEATWNALAGCSIVSEGCINCYAMKWANRMLDKPGSHYHETTKVVNGNAVWTGKMAKAPHKTLIQPILWKKPRLIFANSMSDLFHEDVPDEWIDEIFAVMAIAKQHTFQILTKRPERMRDYLADPMRLEHIYDHWHSFSGSAAEAQGWPLPNVWLGTSVENQKHAEARVPRLLECPAIVRFLSCEPLLGPVNLYLDLRNPATLADDPKLHWVIAGGESGPNARPMHPAWARDLRDQCQAGGVPFFFKQWGEWAPGECAKNNPSRTEQTADYFGDRWHFSKLTVKQSEEMHRDDEPALYRLGKKNVYNTLDGKEWHEMPFHYARAA